MSQIRHGVNGHPPGPHWWASWRPLWQWRHDRIAPVARIMREYGDIAMCQMGRLHFYFLNHPDLIQECLVTRHRSFKKDRYYDFLRIVLGDGLLGSEGDQHLRQRRMMQPAFHRQRMQAYGETMARYAVHHRDKWTDGKQVDMAAEMMELALAIVGKTLFNSHLGAEARKVGQALEHILPMDDRYVGPFGEFYRSLPLRANRRFNAALRQLDELLFRLIREHKKSGDVGDLLSMLLLAQDEEDNHHMTEKQVRDEALTLFLAGHETTAIALTWTWYLLSQHLEVEERFQHELDHVLQGRPPAPADLAKLPYTRCVFAESMRLYPPAYIIGREATEDTALGGYRVPRGSQIIMCPYVTHRDPRFFPDPERFDPERWRPELVEQRPKFSFFPFGGGNRVCIGEPFAWMEGVMVLAAIGQKWAPRLMPGHAVELDPRVTLRPRRGMRMTVHRRETSPAGHGDAAQAGQIVQDKV
ncbi:MAG: cytochrome P450 [Candidatus Hydrogenedentes bacterium]|nr:cytochrome P450 [Candidatus Hydrogenedentota bacterium]MBI3118072.1 cytochrome P450 [Candidatus Hydrogenedentota bacterium]